MARNDITGDNLRSKANTQAYRDNWDKIFGKKESVDVERHSRGSDLKSEEKRTGLK